MRKNLFRNFKNLAKSKMKGYCIVRMNEGALHGADLELIARDWPGDGHSDLICNRPSFQKFG